MMKSKPKLLLITVETNLIFTLLTVNCGAFRFFIMLDSGFVETNLQLLCGRELQVGEAFLQLCRSETLFAPGQSENGIR